MRDEDEATCWDEDEDEDDEDDEAGCFGMARMIGMLRMMGMAV